MSIFQPITLTGSHVHLVPLAQEHHDALITAVGDGDLWRLWYTSIPSIEGMGAEINRRLALQRAGSMIPFTVIDPSSGDIVGMTTYMNIDTPNRRLEIGSTWYAQRVQRTAINTEAKLLLLTHAFEVLDCIAVELRTHYLNQQSRGAIERIGAKLDGILRQHVILANGTIRDTCVYSIIASEWPSIRSHLNWLLARSRQGKRRPR